MTDNKEERENRTKIRKRGIGGGGERGGGGGGGRGGERRREEEEDKSMWRSSNVILLDLNEGQASPTRHPIQ